MIRLHVFALLMAAICLPFSNPSAKETKKVEVGIAFVTKMASMEPDKEGAGGVSQLATFVKQKRETEGHFLFFHGGDSLAPSALSSFTFGAHMIDILNTIEPDVYAVNERELAYKEDQLILRVSEAAFPFLSANIFDPFSGGNLQLVKDHQCFDVDGYQLCVFAVLDPITRESYVPDRLRIDADFNAISRKADDLRKSGADVVVLLASHGEPTLRKMVENGVLDIVLYSSPDEDAAYPIGQGLFVKQGTGDGNVMDIHVTLKGDGSAVRAAYTAETVPLSRYQPSPVVDKKVHYYKTRLTEIMGTGIGKTATPLDTRKNAVRTSETAFGNMVADALKEYYGADLALINGGGIRGNKLYQPGDGLSRQDILSELPFKNVSILAEVKGRDIAAAMENGVSLYEDVKGRFPQISGFAFRFCPERPVGQRVVAVSVGGEPIDPDRLYSLATLDYLFEGGDGYTDLGKGHKVEGAKASNLLWEIVRAYVEKHFTVAPKVENRIVKDCRK